MSRPWMGILAATLEEASMTKTLRTLDLSSGICQSDIHGTGSYGRIRGRCATGRDGGGGRFCAASDTTPERREISADQRRTREPLIRGAGKLTEAARRTPLKGTPTAMLRVPLDFLSTPTERREQEPRFTRPYKL